MASLVVSCENCLLRNLKLPDHMREGTVFPKAFKCKHEDGLSMTATRKIIIGLEDLLDYLREVSRDQDSCLGVAVMSEEQYAKLKLAVTPDPFDDHKYGHLHVLGPKPGEMNGDVRRQLAYIATQSGWSRPPSDTPCV